MRVGIGYDIHRFEEGRRLILGGVLIEGETGLGGHSDADVVLHAIIDALLGAAGKADMGTHFPDSDEQWRNAAGTDLLQRTVDMIRDDGFEPGNVDVTIIAEKPRLAPYAPDMRAQIAQAMGILQGHVSVKATTNEGIGAIGRGEGIAAMAVAVLRSVGE
jgi:2-C-methyl-D-erythritol 2,4-cyclodiphosphate synthase